MSGVTMIVLDIAKHVFHAHGANKREATVFSHRLTQAKLRDFFAAHSRCVVAREACGGAHHWARELHAMGHQVPGFAVSGRSVPFALNCGMSTQIPATV